MISNRISNNYTSRNKKFDYGYLAHSNAFLQFRLKFEHCKLHKVACHPTICDVITDVKLFPTCDVLSQILTLSN